VVIEKWTPARTQVATTAWLSNAESIRPSRHLGGPGLACDGDCRGKEAGRARATPAQAGTGDAGAAIGVDTVANRGCNPRTRDNA
jgi:hypothetical protein